MHVFILKIEQTMPQAAWKKFRSNLFPHSNVLISFFSRIGKVINQRERKKWNRKRVQRTKITAWNKAIVMKEIEMFLRINGGEQNA